MILQFRQHMFVVVNSKCQTVIQQNQKQSMPGFLQHVYSSYCHLHCLFLLSFGGGTLVENANWKRMESKVVLLPLLLKKKTARGKQFHWFNSLTERFIMELNTHRSDTSAARSETLCIINGMRYLKLRVGYPLVTLLLCLGDPQFFQSNFGPHMEQLCKLLRVGQEPAFHGFGH